MNSKSEMTPAMMVSIIVLKLAMAKNGRFLVRLALWPGFRRLRLTVFPPFDQTADKRWRHQYRQQQQDG